MAQIAFGAALGYLDFRFADLGWRTACPALTAWYADFCKRPSMLETRPPAVISPRCSPVKTIRPTRLPRYVTLKNRPVNERLNSGFEP